ncbi:unnamed protein product [Brassicogethes aeneus]|uniref:Carbohydrate kinase PfkB domain-containing protein n=1 Tax=Brassicogethes aeneus TaxID=1431903 RepID=A0A9P0FHK1_BRAAE|nr:unnamed protein product [Brassicogethes aeneus]
MFANYPRPSMHYGNTASLQPSNWSSMVFYEPTDVEISTKPFETNHGKAVKYISPNLEELKFICSYFNITAKNEFCKMRQAASLAEKIVNYVDNVFVTLGSDGLIVSRKGAAKESFPMKNNEQIIQVRHYPANTVENIVNVSGAGDNLASGLIAGILCGLSEEISISIGMEAAKTALKSESAVSQKIFDKYHFCWNTPAQYVSVINKS